MAARLVGQWRSPRHDYQYNADGSWTMLPADPETTHGTWRIDGNQCIDTAALDPPETSQYTIILLTKRDFVFFDKTDKDDVFYVTRLK